MAVVAALCCFITPILVVLLGAVRLSAVLGWIDYALFPLLFFSLAMVAQALWLRAARRGPDPKIWAVLLESLLSVLIIALEFRFALRIISHRRLWPHLEPAAHQKDHIMMAADCRSPEEISLGLLSTPGPLLATGIILWPAKPQTDTIKEVN